MRRKTVPVSYRDRSRDIRQPVCTSHFDSCETKVRATSPHYNKGAVHWLNGNGTEVPSWYNNIEKVKMVLVHFSLVQDGIFELEKALCTPPRLLEIFQTLSFHICPSFIYISIYNNNKMSFFSFSFFFFELNFNVALAFTETTRTPWDWEPRTSTSTFTQLLSSDR